ERVVRLQLDRLEKESGRRRRVLLRHLAEPLSEKEIGIVLRERAGLVGQRLGKQRSTRTIGRERAVGKKRLEVREAFHRALEKVEGLAVLFLAKQDDAEIVPRVRDRSGARRQKPQKPSGTREILPFHQVDGAV